MAGTKQTVEAVQAKLKESMEKLIANAGDLAKVAKESYLDLKKVIGNEDIGQVIADAVVPMVPLPWYVPTWLAKSVVKNAVEKNLARILKTEKK